MAGASLLTLIDDIATLLDDVALLTKLTAKKAAGALDDVAALTKVATKKTAGVLGDDLALNAEQVSGVKAERELPVVWAVAKGSVRNKLILVPAALLISAIAPWAITPLLMAGGLFLAYEGFEKVWHNIAHGEHDDDKALQRGERVKALANEEVDLVAFERDKISGAVRTDFILSAEIIVITLGTVAAANFGTRVTVLVGIAALMTIGVYGVVAGIVKLDDAGVYLSGKAGQSAWQRFQRGLGSTILTAAPWLMWALSIAGTAAMFLVGGGILVHGIPPLHHLIEGVAHDALTIPTAGDFVAALTPTLANAAVGIIAGGLTVAVVSLVQKARTGATH
jgi:predicted DNA repair protein MutK